MTSAAPASPTRDPGLLFVLMQPRPNQIDEFNEWYDDEHIPARRHRAGWLTARRYVTLDHGDTFIAYYDLADLGVLEEPSYRKLREARSEREQRVMGDLLRLDRRIYRPTPSPASAPSPPSAPSPQVDARPEGDPASVCGQLLLCVWWEPAPDSLRTFHRWYAEEHLPMLAGVPGWRRSRRFTLASGEGPTYLAMHDLDHMDVFSHRTYRRAISTPLRGAAVGRALAHERHLYRLVGNFDPDRVGEEIR